MQNLTQAFQKLKEDQEEHNNVTVLWQWDWSFKNEAAEALIPLGELPSKKEYMIFIEADPDYIRSIEKMTNVKPGDLVLLNIGDDGISALLVITDKFQGLFPIIV